MRPTLRILDDAQHELVLEEALRILAEVGVWVAGASLRQLPPRRGLPGRSLERPGAVPARTGPRRGRPGPQQLHALRPRGPAVRRARHLPDPLLARLDRLRHPSTIATAGIDRPPRPTSSTCADIQLADDIPTTELVRELLAEGHLLAAGHTMEHWTTALHLPGPAWDRDARVGWAAKGGPDVVARATAEVERLLASYEPPQIDAAVDREARAIIRAGMAGDAELPA